MHETTDCDNNDVCVPISENDMVVILGDHAMLPVVGTIVSINDRTKQVVVDPKRDGESTRRFGGSEFTSLFDAADSFSVERND